MTKNVKKKFISVILAIATVCAVLPTGMSLVTSGESADSAVGKTAIITENKITLYKESNGSGTNGIFNIPADILPEKVVITETAIGEDELRYKIYPAQGYTWPVSYTYPDSGLLIDNFNEYHWIPASYVSYESGDTFVKDVFGETATDFTLPEHNKTSLFAQSTLTGDVKYSWQICYDSVKNLWVDIQGENSPQLDVTYGKIATLIDHHNSASLRCMTLADGKYNYSSPVTVTVLYDNTIASETYGDNILTYSADYGISTFAETPDIKKNYNIVINYVFEDNTVVAQPYTGSIAEGTSFSETINFPTELGYLPYVNDEQKNSYTFDISSISSDVIINVVYKPTNVNYTVIHYQQNTDNDKYTIELTETKQGLTGSQVPELHKTYEGFYNLLYERPNIAADGSTVIEIYYDRYYYLISFDLDGGYGTTPIYARYGAELGTVPDPTRQGYTFKGWAETKDSTVTVNLPSTVPVPADGNDVKTTYYAIWVPGKTNYMVVYWKENADDDGYSYWGQKLIENATSGTAVSGSDDIPQSIHNDEKKYFTYNPGKTDTNVTVKGDGSTVVNVYYFRNTYTIYFTGISGKCAIKEHTHSPSCDKTLICNEEEHTHNSSCLICGKEEHTKHTDECLICGKEEHTKHTTACYDGVSTSTGSAGWGAPSNPQNGYIARKRWPTNEKVIYIDGKWYGYTGETDVESIAPTTCSGIHTHDASCYRNDWHQHTPDCYSCGKTEHKHTDACYKKCTELEHKHTNQCNSDSTDNVIYVVSAKYEQNIANVWPTADKNEFSKVTLLGWNIDGISSNAVSKRVNMTSDLCDTSDNLKYAKALTGGSTTYLYYMFESFDQTSPANGNDRKYYNVKYYDKSETYYQKVNSNGTWNQKQIYGMTAVSDGVVTSGDNIFLYYTRNRHNIIFTNKGETVKTVNDVMFEQPLKDYKDGDGNLLSSFVPEYPDTLEPNAYAFAGWYTTPECYDGTEFKFETATMPDGDLALYAKWAPVEHTVKFYLTEASTEVYNPDPTTIQDATFTVPHGGYISDDIADNKLSKNGMNAANPNNGYIFVVWYYYKNGKRQYFDPTMPINEDLVLYDEWSSNTLKNYTVQYVLKDNHSIKVADDFTGSGLAGTTKTFDAKGDTELYAEYREGYFPTVQSQSLLLDITSNSLTVIFEYVPVAAVPYTVHYVTDETVDSSVETHDTITVGDKTYTKLAPDTVNSDNRKAVVTETFKSVPGYMPDAYQKRLVVKAGGNNELYFFYTKDETHAYYKITHYIQNTDGATWTEYATSQAKGDIYTRYTASPITINGFTYDKITYVVNGTPVADTDITTEGAELTSAGLEINLYYVRNEYPYQVRYLEQGTGKVLHDPKNESALYGKTISESAIDIDGYDKVEPTSATINIRIDGDENGKNPKINIITFYYTEKQVTINYEVAGNIGGTLSSNSETVKVKNGTAQGSTPTSSDGYIFDGWYYDEDCTQKITDSKWLDSNSKLTPQKDTNGNNVAETYYAKFELASADLTIKKIFASDTDKDSNQTFIFEIKGDSSDSNTKDINLTVTVKGEGEVTVYDLPVGNYTVTEKSDWSWRYEAELASQNVSLIADTTVNFTNKKSKDNWLDFSESVKNIFSKNSSNTDNNIKEGD